MPSSAWAAHTLALALERSKRLNDAEAQFRRCSDLAPDNMALRAEYGHFLLRRRRLKDAEAVVRAIPSHIDLNRVLLLRGEIALRRGRLDEAREFALWILLRDAQHRQAIVLLTLATANRNPFLKLWWRHAQIIAFRPLWQRVLWMGLVVAAGLFVAGLPILFIIYVRLAQRHVNRKVRFELSQVRLQRSF
jgi:predicted Zn-dependent protease